MERISPTYRTLLLLFAFLATGWTNMLNAAPTANAGMFTDEIRVAIMDHLNLDGVAITARASTMRLTADGKTFSLPSGEQIRFEKSGNDVQVRFGSQRVRAREIRLELDGPGAFDFDGGSSSYLRTYTGSLDVTAKRSGDGLSIINRVPIEDYVASVVGAEYGLNDLEGAKAMAIVARTYALHALRQNKELLDSERSQVYQGLQKANAAARQAAQETAGLVLTWNGELIEAVYSASNGGRTASNESVWGTNSLPYLRSRKDPYDTRKSPHAAWTWEMDSGKLEKAMSNAFGLNVRSIRVAETARDGRVTSVELKSRNDSRMISGSSFRAALARSFGAMTVKSTYFDLDKKRNRYVFDGHGFGHGVGLSQWGAHAMALDGRSFDQILDFYYDGTRLQSMPQRTSVTAEVTMASLVEAEASSPINGWSSSSPDVSGADMSRMSISRPSNEESSASLNAVSNETATPKEKKSAASASAKTESAIALSVGITADSVWGSSKESTEEAEKESRPATKKSSRRSGW